MSLASAVRERLNTSIRMNEVSLEVECISKESLDEKEIDEDKRIVKDLMETLESHRKKMKVDNAVIEEFLSNVVDRMDSMDETAKENPALMKYMYSEESVEAIVDTLPMRLRRMCNEQLELWPTENGVHEDGSRVLGSNKAEFKKHREIVRKMCEYFSPINYTNNNGIPTKSLTVLMKECKLHQLAVQRAVWRAQEELSSDSDSSDEESLRSYIGTAEGVTAKVVETPESPKERKKPVDRRLGNSNDITGDNLCAYGRIVDEIEKVRKDYESALLIDNLEKKKKKFREISWESIKISRDILRLNSPRLEEKAAEKFFPVG